MIETRNKLYPSMMCVKPWDTASACRLFERTGIAGLHIDIMDGSFVPNITLGTDYCRALREVTALPLDIHLMIDHPEEKLEWFPIQKGDTVSIHVESTKHLGRAIEIVRKLGGIPFAALDPATSLSAIEDILPELGGVLIMTVNAGFAGQKLIPYTLGKLARLRKALNDAGLFDMPIEVDGNVSAENLVRMKSAGADRFVIGTSGFLKGQPDDTMTQEIIRFQKL